MVLLLIKYNKKCIIIMWNICFFIYISACMVWS